MHDTGGRRPREALRWTFVAIICLLIQVADASEDPQLTSSDLDFGLKFIQPWADKYGPHPVAFGLVIVGVAVILSLFAFPLLVWEILIRIRARSRGDTDDLNWSLTRDLKED